MAKHYTNSLGPDYSDTPTKKCTLCYGKGATKIQTEYHGLKLTAFEPCVRCGGEGILDMDHEEIMFNNELTADHYAEQNEN